MNLSKYTDDGELVNMGGERMVCMTLCGSPGVRHSPPGGHPGLAWSWVAGISIWSAVCSPPHHGNCPSYQRKSPGYILKPELEIGSSAGNAKVYNLKYVGLNVVVELKLFVVHQDSNWLPPLTGSRALAVFLPSLETRDSDEYQFGNTVTGSGGVPGSGDTNLTASC